MPSVLGFWKHQHLFKIRGSYLNLPCNPTREQWYFTVIRIITGQYPEVWGATHACLQRHTGHPSISYREVYIPSPIPLKFTDIKNPCNHNHLLFCEAVCSLTAVNSQPLNITIQSKHYSRFKMIAENYNFTIAEQRLHHFFQLENYVFTFLKLQVSHQNLFTLTQLVRMHYSFKFKTLSGEKYHQPSLAENKYQNIS